VKPGREPISDQTWDAIRTEFTVPSLDQVRRRLSELMEDPEPVMQQLVRDLFYRTKSIVHGACRRLGTSPFSVMLWSWISRIAVGIGIERRD
jgi:hypothetical protein